MKIYGLLESKTGFLLPQLGASPLTYDGIMNETVLHDVYIRSISSKIGILFDLRPSLFIPSGNAGVMVFSDIVDFDLSDKMQATKKGNYVCVLTDSSVTVNGDVISLTFLSFDHYYLSISSKSVSFFTGTIDKLSEAPTSLDDNPLSEYIEDMPSWFDDIHLHTYDYI
jgi:hypothetical protein